MITMDANRTVSGHRLKSELARRALHATDRDPNRKLAWANSICILFLLVGILGFKPGTIAIKPLAPIEQASAALVEPVIPPPQAIAPEPQEEQTDSEHSDAPQVVVVTPDAPSINFAVPTIGNLIVPNAIAKAPPASPLKPAAPLRALPTVLNSTGSSGERPQPPYPKIAIEQAEQGAVVLRMTVNDAGAITDIQVKESSGFPVLDRSAVDFVKRHWTIPPGKMTRIFETTINYKLTL